MPSKDFGWTDFFARQVSDADREAGLEPARVVEEQKGHFRLHTPGGETWGEPSGKLRLSARKENDALWPAVGDWVLADFSSGSDARIERVLARQSKISRAAAGTALKEQVIAANVDVAFALSSLNQDFNPRRLERYLAAIVQSGAEAVVLLTKSDLTEDASGRLDEVRQVAPNVPVCAISSFRIESLKVLGHWLAPGRTCVLLGSSGVGKSTLVNALAGEQWMETGAVRSHDDRGRHTTTYRRMWQLPSGALLIDTPGMRELQNWGLEPDAFEDVREISLGCRFTNCHHEREPGCAIHAALEQGTLSLERWENYLKLEREADFQSRKRDKGAQSRLKSEVRKVHRDHRRYHKAKRGGPED